MVGGDGGLVVFLMLVFLFWCSARMAWLGGIFGWLGALGFMLRVWLVGREVWLGYGYRSGSSKNPVLNRYYTLRYRKALISHRR